MKQKAGNKDHHDSQQRKNQRIRKPPLAPVREPKANADERLFLQPRFLLSRHVHTRSFRFASARHCSARLRAREAVVPDSRSV